MGTNQVAEGSKNSVSTPIRIPPATGRPAVIHGLPSGLDDRAPGLDYYLRRYFLFQTGEGSPDSPTIAAGTWGVTDFPHWQSLRQGAPPGTFQLVYQAGPLIVFRKEK